MKFYQKLLLVTVSFGVVIVVRAVVVEVDVFVVVDGVEVSAVGSFETMKNAQNQYY